MKTAYRFPETKVRLERYHLTLKEATVRLELYRTPVAAREAIEQFVYENNTKRPREALDYVTPATAHFGVANELRRQRQERREAPRAQRIAQNQGRTSPAA